MRLLGLLALALLGLAAYIRLAPSDPARWHVPLAGADPGAAPGEVQAQLGGAWLFLAGDGKALMARLDAVALASPRTRRLSGSLEEGRITYISRSLIWGFPDYTTAEVQAGGLLLHARLRFGQGDRGVNAARLKDWLSRL